MSQNYRETGPRGRHRIPGTVRRCFTGRRPETLTMTTGRHMTDLPAAVNDPGSTPQQRLEALEQFVRSGGLSRMRPFTGETNNHIHTIYSFSPYTPSMAARKAREAGLEVAGSVDHDSWAAADEMHKACGLLRMGCVTGFELRVSFKHTEFASLKINNPDSPGIVYMTVQGIPAGASSRVDTFLQPLHEARHKRNRLMVEKLNGILRPAGMLPLSYDNDILPLSKAAEKGSVTERHILYALSVKITETAGRGQSLTDMLFRNFGITVPDKQKALLSDAGNPHYLYDLLGILKSSFLEKIFIQPDGTECVPAEKATAFARSVGAVPAYAYLGDVSESPTGDKKAEKFEDSFLDRLVPRLKEMGYMAVAYMPPRNTREQLLRLRKLCAAHDLMEISGVDINSSRQRFDCPEIRLPEFAHLTDTTWALAAHETLSGFDSALSLFSPENPLAAAPLEKRIRAYASVGRQLEPAGTMTRAEAAAKLKQADG